MKTIFGIIICLNLFACNYNVYSSEPPLLTVQQTYVTDLDVALTLSKDTGQKIVLIFSADWCGHCQNLKRDFPQIKEFDDKIVCILDSDKNKKMTRQFKAKSLPTSVILSKDGQELSRIVGYKKDTYQKWLQSK